MAACGPSRRWLAITLTLLIGLLLAVGPSPKAYAAPAYTEAPCPVGVPAEHVHRVRCGVLTVPERRGEGSDPGRTIKLPVAIIASHSPTPAPDPVVVPTTGGPGGGTLSALDHFLSSADWAANERDIVLMEQRGDQLSHPTLNCTEFDAVHAVFDDPGTPEPEPPDDGLLRKCRERLAAQGIDVASYSTAASAADLADLRRSLNYDAWNLYGTSYASRLALIVMRDQPEGLRSAVLDGVDPPNSDAYLRHAGNYLGALGTMIAACEADPRCHAPYPEFESSLLTVLENTRRQPITVTVKHPHHRSPVTAVIRDTDITLGLFNALYDPNLVRVLPFIIDQLARDNQDAALPLAQKTVDMDDWFSEGLQTTINCAEEIPFVDEERRAATYTGSRLLERQDFAPHLREYCAVWNVPAVTARAVQGVVSDTPTLLASGGYDPVTPPLHAEIAARGLSRHYAYTFPTMSHGSIWHNQYDPCPAAIAQQFLRDPSVAPDDSCIAATPPTKFLTTDDIRPTPAIYHLNSDVIQDRNPWQIALLITTLVILFAGLVYGVVTLVSPRARLSATGMVSALALALAVAVLNLGFAAGLTAMILAADPLILGFGIPTWARPLGWIAITGVVATAGLPILVGRAWWRRNGALGHRVAVSAVLVASTMFSAWLISRALIIV